MPGGGVTDCLAVMTITGILASAGDVARRSQNSQPFMIGIIKSSRMTSTGSPFSMRRIGVPGVADVVDLVSFVVEHQADGSPQIDVVFDDGDPRFHAAGPCGAAGRERQGHRERRSLAELALDGDGPPVRVDDALRNPESQSEAAVIR